MPCAPAGAYVIFTMRGGLSEPWPTPSTPPSFSRLSAAPSSTSTLTPLPRSSACADFANAAGDFSSAGVFTASRAQITASLIMRPRSSAAVTARATPADHDHLLELRRLPVGLVLEVLVPAEREALGDRLRHRRLVQPRRRGVEQRGRDDLSPSWPGARARPRRCGCCRASARPARRARRGPRPWRPSPPLVGTASVWPGLPSKPASSMNAASPPPTARSTTSAPGPSSAGAKTGTARRSAATLDPRQWTRE